jgi:hypothetical protein
LRLGKEALEDPKPDTGQHRLGSREARNKVEEGPSLAPGEESSEG